MKLFNFISKSKKVEYQYVDKGEGPIVILLHGLLGELSNFEYLMEVLPTKGYRVVAPLFPVYDLDRKNTSVAGLAEYLNNFVIEKDFNDFTLLGNSLGGHVALYYSYHFPGRTHSIALTGSSGLYEDAMGATFPKRGDKKYIEQKTREVFYDPNFATDELLKNVYKTTNNLRKALSLVYFAKSAIRHNMSKELLEMKMPVCIIWGKNDIVTPPKVAEEFHQLLPNSELHWIDKCGHAPMMERPEEFFDIFYKWLVEANPKNA